MHQGGNHHEALYLLAVAGDVSSAHRAQPEGLAYEPIYVDLDAGQQRQSSYKSVNPQMVLPSLVEDDGNVLYQSLAIMEYLDEVYPEPPLLPADPRGRARVRRCHRSRLPTLIR